MNSIDRTIEILQDFEIRADNYLIDQVKKLSLKQLHEEVLMMRKVSERVEEDHKYQVPYKYWLAVLNRAKTHSGYQAFVERMESSGNSKDD